MNIRCVSNNPNFFLANLESEHKNECVVKLRKQDFQLEDKPKILSLKIIADSQVLRTQEKYQIEAKVDLPFISSFNIKDKVNQIFFTKTNRTSLIEIDNINDLEFNVEDPSFIKYEVIPRDQKEPNKIKITVFRNVSTSFDDFKFIIKNKFTNQKEELELNFDVDRLTSDDVYYFFLFTRAQLLDIFTIIVLISLVIFMIKYFILGGVRIILITYYY